MIPQTTDVFDLMVTSLSVRRKFTLNVLDLVIVKTLPAKSPRCDIQRIQIHENNVIRGVIAVFYIHFPYLNIYYSQNTKMLCLYKTVFEIKQNYFKGQQVMFLIIILNQTALCNVKGEHYQSENQHLASQLCAAFTCC